MIPKKAVILFSGGIDSTVCVALAKELGYQCYALTIDYQQRHHCEIEYAKKQAHLLAVTLHRICRLEIGGWGGSALTDKQLKIPQHNAEDTSNTYVSARNTIFLAAALGWAEVIEAHDIFIGANRMDFKNYPDCRPEYFAAFANMANLATREGVAGAKCSIHTPLINFDKVDIIKEGLRLKIDFDLTFSCYNPDEEGKACQQCGACELRLAGFAALVEKTSYCPDYSYQLYPVNK